VELQREVGKRKAMEMAMDASIGATAGAKVIRPITLDEATIVAGECHRPVK
jgi:hypothetical protein